jgi:hypothetical protein
MKNDPLVINVIDFLSKACKSNKHTICSKKWYGLGLNFECLCSCHSDCYLKRKNSDQTCSSISSSSYCGKDKILVSQENENLDFKHPKKINLLVNSLHGSTQQVSNATGGD